MKMRFESQSGFTFLELVIGLAIVAILAAVAVVAYMKYGERAQGVDIVGRYDAIRTGVAARAQSAKSDDCAELAKGLDATNLSGSGATLAYGFEAVSGGYRPVLTVCAQAGTSGPQGVKTARGAYETLAKNGVVEKNAVLTDTVVSYALRLTQGDQPLCRTAPPQPASACGQPQQVAQAPTQPAAQPAQPPQAAVTTPPACPTGQVRDASGTCVAPAAPLPPVPQPRANQPAPQPVAAAASCPAGQEKVLITSSGTQAQSACAPRCQSGERRNTAGLCIKDEPPPPPAWAANQPGPGTPPPPAQPGRLPACPDGTKLLATFVNGALTNTCVKECAAGETVNASGQCVARCRAPMAWDGSLNTCVNPEAPPACPSGLVRNAGASACTCPNSGEVLQPDGTCRVRCIDDYGSTCHADFGQAMCTDRFVSDMCVKFCTGCTGQWTTAYPETRGEGTKPTMPYFGPPVQNMLPRAIGETLVLDDQALVRMFGVTSPDGSPLSVTSLKLGGQAQGDDMWSVERRDDGRWVIRTVGDTTRTVQRLRVYGSENTYNSCDSYRRIDITFTNASGSTTSAPLYMSCH